MASGRYSVGMQGPGEAIVWTVAAPLGVDLATASTRVLSATFYLPGGTSLVVAPADWTLSNITASSLTATYIPDGSEFTSAGTMLIRTTLTVDGVTYRYLSQTETIHAEP